MEDKDYLRKFKISAWDLIQATSGGHKNITNLSSLDFFKKGKVSYVSQVIKSVMAAMTEELSRVQLRNVDDEGNETFEDYLGDI